MKGAIFAYIWQLAKTLLTHSCVCPKPVVRGVFTPHSERLGVLLSPWWAGWGHGHTTL